MRRLAATVFIPIAALALGASCVPEFDATRDPVERGSFGETLYREGCQRLAYSAQREERAAGLRETIDVNGSRYGAVCVSNAPTPEDAPQKLKVLQQQRGLIVGAVDHLLPESFLDDAYNYLLAIVPLHEDGTMEDALGKLAALLGTLKDDAEFNGALVRLASRLGYRPLKSGDLVRTTVGYPKIDEFFNRSLDLFLGKDDLPTVEFRALLTAVSRELRAATPHPTPASPDRTLRIALDLLKTSSPAFGDGEPRLLVERDHRGVAQVAMKGPLLPPGFVDNNGDGLADIDPRSRFVGADGKPLPVASPFPQAGAPDPSKRDAQGRWIDDAGQPLYRYVDLERTLLAGLARETVSLVDPTRDDTLGLVYGATALLGPRTPAKKSYPMAPGRPVADLAYSGFATRDAALLDLVHAFLQILGDPNADDTLRAVRTLLTKYESQTTRVIKAAFDANDSGAKYPKAVVPATATIYDDLIPILLRILRVPGLLEDMLDALENPHAKGLAPMLAKQLDYKDRFILDQNTQRVTGSFANRVDRGQPDVDWNRSIMQRMAHLVHDAAGGQFCNKDGAKASLLGFSFGNYKKCEMFRIDDLGLFFVLTIADRAIVDDKTRPETRNMASFREHLTDPLLKGLISDNDGLLGSQLIESLTGIEGFGRFPTPAAAARSLFLDPAHQSDFMRNSTEPVRCNDGDRFLDVHNDSIFAWEAPLPGNPSGFANDSFYDAVRPLINAFARRDECMQRDEQGGCKVRRNAARIFVDLVAVLHRHWGSPGSTYFGQKYQSQLPNSPRYSAGSSIVNYEPLLDDVLRGDLVPAIVDLGPALRTMTIDGTPNGKRFRPNLVPTLQYLFDPAAAPATLAYRDGTTTTLRADKTPGPRATPYALLADAFAHKRAQLGAARAEQRDAWKYATTHLVDQLLSVEKDNAGYRLKSRRAKEVTLTLLDFVRARLAAHAGDKAAWLHKELPGDVERLFSGPVFAALGDLTARIEESPPARQSLYELLDYFVNQAKSDAAFQAALTSLADNVQLFLDDADMVPVAHAVGAALDPESGPLEAEFKLMQRSRRLDPNCDRTGKDPSRRCTLVTILRNLYQDTPRGVTPAFDLADALAEVNRATPGAGSEYSAADYSSVFGNIQQFFTDEERGFLRFIDIVKHRRYP